MTTDVEPKLNFAEKASTNIWFEEPSNHNPYLAKTCRLHGYDILQLAQRKSFVEVLYLLYTGELPSVQQAKLLEQLMIFLLNPGPRHPATRAAMTAGISKARPAHILPVGLMALGGEHLGAAEVEHSMNYLINHVGEKPETHAARLLGEKESPTDGDWHIIPGFGTRFGGIDPAPQSFINDLLLTHSGKFIQWGQSFAVAINARSMGWLSTGIAAAVLLDLGIKPREGSGLFQLFSAPGILAHGMEQTHKPVTEMPFVEDKDYVIEQ